MTKDKPVILVVDDHPQNIELLKAHLVPEGYEIVSAANGEEALGKLSENQIDLILLDIMMPDMDGYEVTRRVRRENSFFFSIAFAVSLCYGHTLSYKGGSYGNTSACSYESLSFP
jgi:CheY-like chemotaxis protein